MRSLWIEWPADEAVVIVKLKAGEGTAMCLRIKLSESGEKKKGAGDEGRNTIEVYNIS